MTYEKITEIRDLLGNAKTQIEIAEKAIADDTAPDRALAVTASSAAMQKTAAALARLTAAD
jgi:hypothetical protein